MSALPLPRITQRPSGRQAAATEVRQAGSGRFASGLDRARGLACAIGLACVLILGGCAGSGLSLPGIDGDDEVIDGGAALADAGWRPPPVADWDGPAGASAGGFPSPSGADEAALPPYEAGQPAGARDWLEPVAPSDPPGLALEPLLPPTAGPPPSISLPDAPSMPDVPAGAPPAIDLPDVPGVTPPAIDLPDAPSGAPPAIALPGLPEVAPGGIALPDEAVPPAEHVIELPPGTEIPEAFGGSVPPSGSGSVGEGTSPPPMRVTPEEALPWMRPATTPTSTGSSTPGATPPAGSSPFLGGGTPPSGLPIAPPRQPTQPAQPAPSTTPSSTGTGSSGGLMDTRTPPRPAGAASTGSGSSAPLGERTPARRTDPVGPPPTGPLPPPPGSGR